MFIVRINDGNIGYSVFKNPDYATSIVTGPCADYCIGDTLCCASQSVDSKDAIL